MTLWPALLIAVGQAEVLRVYPEELNASHHGKRVVVLDAQASSVQQDGVGGKIISLRGARNVKVVTTQRMPAEADIEGNVQVRGNVVTVLAKSFSSALEEDVRFLAAAEAARDDPEEWFKLERWALRRATLYHSAGMKDKCLEAYRGGLAALRKRAAGDPARLRELRSRIVKDNKLAGFDFGEFDHALQRAEFARLPAGDAAALEAFRTALEKALPGAGEPQEPTPGELAVRYRANPLETFAKEKLDRPLLARQWRNDLVEQRLEALRKQGEAPFDLAQLARKLAPDLPGLAKRWLRDYAGFQAPRIKELDRGAAGKFAALVETELDDPAAARRLRRTWLEEREADLKKRERDRKELAEGNGLAWVRDPKPWHELFQARMEWFAGDPAEVEAARGLLREIASYAPDFPPLEQELPKFGFTRRPDGSWLPHNAPDAPAAPKPARVELVVQGMGVAEVAGLMGAPKRTVRVGARGGLLMHWLYDTPEGEYRITFKGLPATPRVARTQTLAKGDALP